MMTGNALGEWSALTPAMVATAAERIAAECSPQAILVFGSRARGEARPDSDLDLLVLVRSQAPDGGVLRRRLRARLADMPFAKDILVSDLVSFEESRQQLNSVYRDIAEESLALWRDGRLDALVAEQVCR
jgi:predicted nucleotidyltransferase